MKIVIDLDRRTLKQCTYFHFEDLYRLMRIKSYIRAAEVMSGIHD